jgi:predicted Zn-dependent peptidase
VTHSELLEVDEIITRIDAVSAENVRQLAEEFWQPERFSLAAIGPDGDAVRQAVEQFSPALAG